MELYTFLYRGNFCSVKNPERIQNLKLIKVNQLVTRAENKQIKIFKPNNLKNSKARFLKPGNLVFCVIQLADGEWCNANPWVISLITY